MTRREATAQPYVENQGNNPPPDDKVEKICCCSPDTCTCIISVSYIIVSVASFIIHLLDVCWFLKYTGFQKKFLLDIFSFIALNCQVFAINVFVIGTLLRNVCCSRNPDAAVANPDAAVATQDATVATQDAAVETPDATVATQDAAVETPDATVATQDAAVETPDAAVATQDAAVATQDAAVAALNAAVATQDAAGATPDAAVATLDAAVATQDAAVATPDAAVATQDATVPTPDAAVAAPNAAGATPDAAVETPDAAVATPDAAVVIPDAALYNPECRKPPKLFEIDGVGSSIKFFLQSSEIFNWVCVIVMLCLINSLVRCTIEIILFEKAECKGILQILWFVGKQLCFLCCYCPFWCHVYIQRSNMKKQLTEAPSEIQKLAPSRTSYGESEQAHEARDSQAFEARCHKTWRLVEGIYSEFKSLQKFTGWCMVFTLLTITFHIICCGVLFRRKILMSQPLDKDKILPVKLWCENIVFISVPFIALGWFNIDYLWNDFHRRLMQSTSEAEAQFMFWSKALNMIIQINAVSFPISFMQVLSLFSGTVLAWIFSQSDSLSFEYWIYVSNCAVKMDNTPSFTMVNASF